MSDYQHGQLLSDTHDAIEDILRAALPAAVNVASYPNTRKSFALPCALVEFADTDPADDLGTEELAVNTRWNVVCIVAPELKNSELMVRQFAATVAAALRKASRTGVRCVGFISNLHFSPDELHPELHGYEAWTVSFSMSMAFGDSVFTVPEDAGPVSEVWVGFAPDVGADNQDEYERV